MTLGALIETHGYWVLAVGCFLEGETVLVLAGFAASRGYLDPFAVLGVAAAAGFLGDQFYFWLGRRHGPAVLARWPSALRQADRVHRLMERYHAAVIIGVRFAYGLRIAGPILIGTSPVPGVRFALFNALGAMLWAFVVAGIGWVFGEAAEIVLGEIRNVEGWLLLGLIVAAASVWWVRKRRTR
ncbi:MAG: DedA family protein [Pseudomonadota bacterium]